MTINHLHLNVYNVNIHEESERLGQDAGGREDEKHRGRVIRRQSEVRPEWSGRLSESSGSRQLKVLSEHKNNGTPLFVRKKGHCNDGTFVFRGIRKYRASDCYPDRRNADSTISSFVASSNSVCLILLIFPLSALRQVFNSFLVDRENIKTNIFGQTYILVAKIGNNNISTQLIFIYLNSLFILIQRNKRKHSSTRVKMWSL